MQHVRLYTSEARMTDMQAAAIQGQINTELQDNPTWRVESVSSTATPETPEAFPKLITAVIFNDEPYATISESIPAEAEGIPDVATSLAAITGELKIISGIFGLMYKNGLTVETRRAD